MIGKARESLFFDLPKPDFPEDLHDFVLDSPGFEREIARRNGGLDLSSEESIRGISPEDLNHYRRMIPFLYDPYGGSIKKLMGEIEGLVGLHDGQPAPSAMLLRDRKGLGDAMVIVGHSAYAHYVCMKRQYQDFPNYFCGESSRSMFGSLLGLGFPNVAILCAEPYDHVYAGLPFVLEEGNVKGTIVVDPTSDQCVRDGVRQDRNLIAIKLGSKWKYRNGWCGDADLFPTVAMHLGTLRGRSEDIRNLLSWSLAGPDFFETAFANPVRVSLQDIGS